MMDSEHRFLLFVEGGVHHALHSFPTRRSSDLPLMAQPGGVLSRAGHTEAACDLTALAGCEPAGVLVEILQDRKSTRLNSSHPSISYAVFCLKKKRLHRKVRGCARNDG